MGIIKKAKRYAGYIRETHKLAKGFTSKAKDLEKQQDQLKGQVERLRIQNVRLEKKLKTMSRDMKAISYQRDLMFYTMYKTDAESIQEARERFFLSLPVMSDEMVVKQQCIGILLHELKQLCEKNDIRYWLDFGTLLGAVRHRGFIPWDDDADIGMLRSDIPKLQAAIEESDTLAFIDFLAVTKNSVCQIYRVGFKKIQNPCFIDIFIYDSIATQTMSDAETWEIYKEHRRELIAKGEVLWTAEDRRNSPYRNGSDPATRDRVASPEAERKIRDIKQETLASITQKLGFTDEVGESLIWGIDNTMFSKIWVFKSDRIFPLKTLEFEGEMYPVPAESETLLKHNYGDIWTMPGNMLTYQHLSLSEEELAEMEATIKKYEQS